MPHIPLFICFNALICTSSLYNMEKEIMDEQKNKSFFLQKRKRIISNPSVKSTESLTSTQSSNDSASSLSITITTTTSSESVDSSQTTPSKSTKQLARSRTTSHGKKPKEHEFFKTLSLSDSVPTFAKVKISPRVKRNILTEAVRNYDLDTINLFINNPDADLNQKDQYGNTALHHAVITLSKPINNEPLLRQIILLFLRDPRTDSSIIRDTDNRTAQQLLLGGENPELRQLLFARATLDITTNHEIGKMFLNSYIHNIPLNDDCITKTIAHIKNKIHGTEIIQEDSRPLPEEAKLPEYATDDFIFTMIKKRIPLNSEHPSELQKEHLRNIFTQEINMILLNVSIDINEESVQESIDNILVVINHSYTHLIKFINKPSVFEILKTYTDAQKTKNDNVFTNFIQKK